MHPEAYAFIQQHVPAQPGHVAEVGAYNVNGSVRGLFAAALSYTGFDVRPGPGVDEVKDLSAWKGAPRFGLIVSTETLEHAPDARALLRGMLRALRPGGLLLLTCAAPERAPHGQDGLINVPDGEPYANVEPEALRMWAEEAGASVSVLEHHPARGDLYAVIKGAK